MNHDNACRDPRCRRQKVHPKHLASDRDRLVATPHVATARTETAVRLAARALGSASMVLNYPPVSKTALQKVAREFAALALAFDKVAKEGT